MLIAVNRAPSEQKLANLGVSEWPIWTKEVSEFPWTYDEPETCYFLEGDVVIKPEDEAPVTIRKGDLVVFPKGMTCVWKISKPVKKHYRFG